MTSPLREAPAADRHPATVDRRPSHPRRMPKLPAAIAARRPERPSFVTVLAGAVYVAAPKPDSDGYTLRRYMPDDEHDTYPA